MITVPATPDLVTSLLAQLPPPRRGKFSAAGITDDIAKSDITYCGIDAAAAVVTMGGVMPTGQPGIGYVWQIITDVAAHKRDYLRQGRTMIGRFHTLYPQLLVCIEAENTAARRHARRLGWTDLAPISHHGVLARIYQRTTPK
jgi:hypothetical protein